MSRALVLGALPSEFAVARLAATAPTPGWATGKVSCVARTPTELSVLCEAKYVPANVESERGWRCLFVKGILDFSEVGILSALSGALAQAGLSLLAFSTFETDYLLVRAIEFDRALEALAEAGFPTEID